MKYTIKTLNLTSDKQQDLDFEGEELSSQLSHHIHQVYTNQKKDRYVFASSKTRSDFTSGGAKPFRQKGTGRARRGTNRSPLVVGGAGIFTPKPRRVRRKTNARFFNSVLRQLLLTKITRSIVLDEFSEIKKVKDFKKNIHQDKSYLLILDINVTDNVQLFNRIKNIPNIYFNTVNSILIEDLLRVDEIYYTNSSFNSIFLTKGENND